MKKFILPLFLLLTTAFGFTSCSDDDDDKSATITMSINGKAVENEGLVILSKTTVDTKNSESNLITISLVSDCDINGIQISVKNAWEDNVDVIDVDTIAHNSNHAEKVASQSKVVSFVGVIGTYTMKVKTSNGTKSYKFTVKDANNESEYVGNGRWLSNKQLVIFDATGDTHAKTILGETFVVDRANNIQYLNGNMSEITESDYEKYQEYGKGDFQSVAERLTYSKKYNISKITPTYFIYKNGEKYYLMKIISLDGNILTAEVQY